MIKGEGAPVVYLHGPFGQEWDGFLDDLAAYRRVYAPAHAGAEETEDLEHLDGLRTWFFTTTICLTASGSISVDLVGHSFGGMVAAEYAATFRDRVRKLVLIDAMGLWRDDAPVADHLLVSPREAGEAAVQRSLEAGSRRQARDADGARRDERRDCAALRRAGEHVAFHPSDSGARAEAAAPRIKAETLVLWGAQDALVPPSYAAEFAALIPNARVQMIQKAGHVPQIEQRKLVSEHLERFLRDRSHQK